MRVKKEPDIPDREPDVTIPPDGSHCEINLWLQESVIVLNHKNQETFIQSTIHAGTLGMGLTAWEYLHALAASKDEGRFKSIKIVKDFLDSIDNTLLGG